MRRSANIFVLIVFLFVFHRISYAQFQTHLVSPPDETVAQNEVTIAMDPNDVNVAVAVWRHLPMEQPFIRIGVGVTFDGGLTWSNTTLEQTENTNLLSDPVVAVGPDGDFYIAVLHRSLDIILDKIQLYRSTRFPGMIYFDPADATDAIFNPDSSAYVDKEWMHVWRPTGSATDHILISCQSSNYGLTALSTDGGETFENLPYHRAQISGEIMDLWDYCTVMPDGNPAVFFPRYTPDESADSSEICCVYYDPETENWTDLQILKRFVNTPLITNGNITVFPYPAVAVDNSSSPYNGTVHLIYMQLSPDCTDEDICYMQRTPEGDWTESVRLNDDELNNGCDQFHPAIAVDEDGVIHAIWYDRRNDPNNLLVETMYVFSEDGGQTWSEQMPLTPAPFDPTDDPNYWVQRKMAEYIDIDAHFGYVMAIWSESREGDMDIYCTQFERITGIDNQPGSAIPSDFSLKTYPNPFNSHLTVRIELPKAAFLSLSVYDLLGRQIMHPVNGLVSNGRIEKTLGFQNIASGVYFVQALIPGNNQEVQKVVMIR